MPGTAGQTFSNFFSLCQPQPYIPLCIALLGTLDVYVSSLAAPGDPEGAEAANWTRIGDNVTFAQYSTTNNTGFDYETQTGTTIASAPVRHVRFEPTATFGNTSSGYVGLAEVQFFAAVPEPSAALLGGIGFLALLRRRR